MAFVLVHGGYHGAWTWDRLLPLLDKPALAVDLPGRGSRPAPLDDVTISSAAESVVADIEAWDEGGEGGLTLVGHSLGGATLPAIAGRLGDRLANLVFVSAFVVPDGQSVMDSMPPAERAGAARRLQTGPGQRSELSRESHRELLADGMSESDIEYVLERVGPDSMHFFTDTVSWAGVSSAARRIFVRLEQDHALTPPAQEQMISHLGAPEDVTVYSIDSAHEVMITRPAELAAVLNKI